MNAFDTPWKITNKILSWIDYPFVRILFALNGISWGRGWRFFGIPIVQKHRQSRMEFGDFMHLRSSVHSNPLGPNHPVFFTTWEKDAHLRIGSHFAMSGGTICCAKSITIGNNVSIGGNTTVVDTDFHPLLPSDRHVEHMAGKSVPIIIEDDVFIGMNCLILKGVTIGCGSVIGAGSIVTRSIPPGVIAAGNPAKVIGELQQ
jgi:acetyltransferase-like isoleucine patch superfamily enzyme